MNPDDFNWGVFWALLVAFAIRGIVRALINRFLQ